jgi:glutathione S-transferase
MPVPRLWSWSLSPFAGKARIVLAEKGIEVELLEIDPRNRPQRLRQLNPAGRVPVLEVDGTGIPESTVICEWAEEMRPDPPLWPQDPTARAAARGLLAWLDDALTGSFFLSMRREAFGLEPTDHPDVVQTLRARLARNWPVLEARLALHDGTWLLPGREPTLLDLAAIPLAVRLPEWKPELEPDPNAQPRTEAWLAALRARPSAVEVGRRGEPVAAG